MHRDEGLELAKLCFVVCVCPQIQNCKTQYSYYFYVSSTFHHNQLHQIEAMADPDHDIAATPNTPAPPVRANDVQRPNAAGVTFGFDQNHPAASSDLVITPPPVRAQNESPSGKWNIVDDGIDQCDGIEQRCRVCGRIVFRVTLCCRSSACTDTTPIAGSKRRASALREEEEESSPIYPDYSIPKSSGDSVASGNDSGQ